MFLRPGSGRKRAGIESHVPRPMTTALQCPAGVPLAAGAVLLLPAAASAPPAVAPSTPSVAAGATAMVTSLKNAMSFFSRHGSSPLSPIPPLRVAATTAHTRLPAIFNKVLFVASSREFDWTWTPHRTVPVGRFPHPHPNHYHFV